MTGGHIITLFCTAYSPGKSFQDIGGGGNTQILKEAGGVYMEMLIRLVPIQCDETLFPRFLIVAEPGINQK